VSAEGRVKKEGLGQKGKIGFAAFGEKIVKKKKSGSCTKIKYPYINAS
jgi:hypothetical protein